MSAPAICGVISPAGPFGEPLACAYAPNPSNEPMHEHSWATLPTFLHTEGSRWLLPIEITERAVQRARELGNVLWDADARPAPPGLFAIVKALAALPEYELCDQCGHSPSHHEPDGFCFCGCGYATPAESGKETREP